MSGDDDVSTTHLAAWFGISTDGVVKRMRRAGIKPVGRAAHNVSIWPRMAALTELYRGRPTRRGEG